VKRKGNVKPSLRFLLSPLLTAGPFACSWALVLKNIKILCQCFCIFQTDVEGKEQTGNVSQIQSITQNSCIQSWGRVLDKLASKHRAKVRIRDVQKSNPEDWLYWQSSLTALPELPNIKIIDVSANRRWGINSWCNRTRSGNPVLIQYYPIPLSIPYSIKIQFNIIHPFLVVLSDRRLSAKLVPTSADRGCREVSTMDPHGRILAFLNRSRCFFFFSSSSLNVLKRLRGA
jgi:hypothetical protein